MDYIETRKAALENICSVYGVPSPMISNVGDVNLANAETSRRMFWLDTVIPLLDWLTESLTKGLAREYGDDIRISYDLTGIPALQENMTDKIANAQALFSMGVPINQINQLLELGLDDITGGDVGYVNGMPTTYDTGALSDEKKAVIDGILRK